MEDNRTVYALESAIDALKSALKEQIATGQIAITGVKYTNVSFGAWKESCPRCGRSKEEDANVTS